MPTDYFLKSRQYHLQKTYSLCFVMSPVLRFYLSFQYSQHAGNLVTVTSERALWMTSQANEIRPL
jgi:hypothetical protein